ncbi:hypothetical protein GPALN_004847 [Globodera pallida]|nr:hypothetical protein GPALN_004847 [Globodera pallida]
MSKRNENGRSPSVRPSVRFFCLSAQSAKQDFGPFLYISVHPPPITNFRSPATPFLATLTIFSLSLHAHSFCPHSRTLSWDLAHLSLSFSTLKFALFYHITLVPTLFFSLTPLALL